MVKEIGGRKRHSWWSTRIFVQYYLLKQMASWGCLISQNRCLWARWLLNLPDLRKRFAQVRGNIALISLHFPLAPDFDSYSLFQQSEFCPHTTGMKMLLPWPLLSPNPGPSLCWAPRRSLSAVLTTRPTETQRDRCLLPPGLPRRCTPSILPVALPLLRPLCALEFKGKGVSWGFILSPHPFHFSCSPSISHTWWSPWGSRAGTQSISVRRMSPSSILAATHIRDYLIWISIQLPSLTTMSPQWMAERLQLAWMGWSLWF